VTRSCGIGHYLIDGWGGDDVMSGGSDEGHTQYIEQVLAQRAGQE